MEFFWWLWDKKYERLWCTFMNIFSIRSPTIYFPFQQNHTTTFHIKHISIQLQTHSTQFWTLLVIMAEMNLLSNCENPFNNKIQNFLGQVRENNFWHMMQLCVIQVRKHLQRTHRFSLHNKRVSQASSKNKWQDKLSSLLSRLEYFWPGGISSKVLRNIGEILPGHSYIRRRSIHGDQCENM
jgi:hypothetical protein